MSNAVARGTVGMKNKLRLSMFQIGAPRRRGEGLRIGATRRPPRGVPKSRWVKGGFFDLWLPALAPSSKLLQRYRHCDFGDRAVSAKFYDAYERELLSSAESRQTVQFVALVAKQIPVSIGCYCPDASRCHRTRLHKIITRFA